MIYVPYSANLWDQVLIALFCIISIVTTTDSLPPFGSKKFVFGFNPLISLMTLLDYWFINVMHLLICNWLQKIFVIIMKFVEFFLSLIAYKIIYSEDNFCFFCPAYIIFFNNFWDIIIIAFWLNFSFNMIWIEVYFNIFPKVMYQINCF